jgi:hypothetical protein
MLAMNSSYKYLKWLLITGVVLVLMLLLCLLFYSSRPKQIVFSKTVRGIDTLAYNQLVIDKEVSFEFENTSKVSPITFWFYNQHGINYHSATTMLESILHDSIRDEGKAIAIWRLVTASGFHYNYDYTHILQDHVDPISLVTFPYFMCGEKAGVIVNLAKIAGFNARSVELDGHVVAEIYFDKTWHMFDADENCIFRNTMGQIASVEELHKNPQLVNESSVEFSLRDNFYGYNKYKNYIKNYKSSWVDSSSAIANYSFPTNAITLYPSDKVSFRLIPTSFLTRLFRPRYLYEAEGSLSRTLSIGQNNVEVRGDQVTFVKNFPYYLTQLHITSDTLLDAKVYFVFRDRETGKLEESYLGQLNSRYGLTKKFQAPVNPDIYYSFQIVFKHCNVSQLAHVKVQQAFEFNSITFPLYSSDNKIIFTDTDEKRALVFQIVK